MISRENYEEYMMMHADGELGPAEVQELMVFLEANPKLKKEMAMYELTKLHPDGTLIYENKDSLLKPDTSKRIIALPQWRKYAIAAGVGLLIGIGAYEYKEVNKTNNNEVVKVDTITPALPAPRNDVPVQNEPQQGADNIAAAPVQPQKTTPAIPHQEHKAIVPDQHIAHKQQQEDALVNNTTVVKHSTEISSLSIAEAKTLPYEEHKTPLPVAVVPATPVAPATQENAEKQSFWDKLPLDESKKKNMENIAGTVANVYDGIGKARQEISEKKLSIRIENKKLKLSF